MTEKRPTRVALIGGGCAAMTTAFELTRPELEGRYEVTIYQLGWRLGGKGASGRGPSGRIEEHGLHLWMGFYENAFRVMRQCYAAAGRDPATCKLATFDDAFQPDHYNGVADWSPSGDWLPWTVELPALDGVPGDDANVHRRWTVADYLARTLSLLRSLLGAVQVKAGDTPESASRKPGKIRGAGAGSPDAVVETMLRMLRFGQLAGIGALYQAIQTMEMAVLGPGPHENVLLQFHDMLAAATRRQLESLLTDDDESRRLWEIIDLVLAVIRGMIRFRLMTDPRGFDAIDDYDCREWLMLNGASERSVNSAFIRALYDLAFGYEDGDVARPKIAAGQAMRGAVRAFFTYRGAFFWKMQSGMGDTVFAPFYEVLKKRGVRFEYFHELTNMKVCDAADVPLGEHPWIEALEFDVQARVKDGAEYQPLVDYDTVPCWPAEPDWSQLEDGEKMRDEGWLFECWWDRRKVGDKTLLVGRDFDVCVLAVGVGAVRHVSKELIERSERWRKMVDAARSVATQATQIWTRVPMNELGWERPPINISGFVEPFDTWADMTHLGEAETWEHDPRAIAYFCSCMPDDGAGEATRDEDPQYPRRREVEVRQNAIELLDRDIVHLWPNAHRPGGGFRWDVLAHAPEFGDPEQYEHPIDTQFWKANVSPTDRYSLSIPGTIQDRVSPLEVLFDNLTIAGDWTSCGFNEGCVEAAVMSGLLAAHAVSGTPALEDIVGYDHP